MNEFPNLRVLAVDPFHGGSHLAFLRGVVDHSRHDWRLVVGKAVHWKWRMRSASLELAVATRREIANRGYPDVILCSDMLDLPQWRGVLRDPRILETPSALYFHENQWTYPLAPQARVDFHFGYTNLLSALAADACWFNSAFHRDDFLQASKSFVQRMPDAHHVHDFDQLESKCRVIPPGFSVPQTLAARGHNRVLTIGWVSRWEHDKRPDDFVELLSRLDRQSIEFQLVLLGPRPVDTPQALKDLRNQFPDRIVHDDFAETVDEYWSWLSRLDVVVSTAEHEFFGIAVCEAIWAGAVAVLPNRLSYPELVPRECLYESLDDAVMMIEKLQDAETRNRLSDACRKILEPLRMEQTVPRLDDALQRLVAEVRQ